MLEQIAAGEIHLTGLLLLGPHLTDQNHQELLALARHRTKRDILRLIRRIDPQPDAPASVEPLGPAPVGVPIPTTNPSWEDFIEALSPPVRELPQGDNPREWSTATASNDDSDLGARTYELHHLHPEALGGPPTAENLTLRCKAHNALAAEQDFGRDFMETKRRVDA